jgi:uncharacterized protein YukJ
MTHKKLLLKSTIHTPFELSYAISKQKNSELPYAIPQQRKTLNSLTSFHSKKLWPQAHKKFHTRREHENCAQKPIKRRYQYRPQNGLFKSKLEKGTRASNIYICNDKTKVYSFGARLIKAGERGEQVANYLAVGHLL